MRATLTILGKDLRLRLRDRSVLMFALVVPLGLTFLFSMILPSEGDLTISAAVIDLDGSDASAAFATDVVPGLVDAGLVELADIEDEQSALDALGDDEVHVVWRFPEGFGDRLQSGGAAQLDVLVSAGDALRGEVARGIARSYASELDRVSLTVATTAAAGGASDPEQLQAAAEAAADAAALVSTTSLAAQDQQLGDTSYLAAGMAAFFVFFTVQFGVTGLLEEQDLGTLPRLLASPIPPIAVHAGKAAGAFLLGIVSMVVLAVASDLFLGADWGPPVGVAVLIVAMVAAASGLMAFVGTFAKTAEQASNLQSIVAVVIGMLGGVFFPVSFGGVLQYLTRIAPHGWFLDALGRQAGSGEWWDVLPGAAAIVAFGVVSGGLAILRLRRSTR